MRFFSTLAAVSVASLVATAAPLEERSSTSQAKLYARAEVTNIDASIEAHVEFWGHLDGTGTFIKVEVLKGLYEDGPGPYPYHIHTNPVGKDLNCNDALGHLDPLNVTESLICDPAFPQYCQEGDISGKTGKLNGTTTGAIPAFGFSSNYARFFPEDFSILGRSIVIHSSNLTRLACGNIISTLDGTANSKLQPTWKPSTFVKNYPTAPPFNPAQVVTPFIGTVFPSNETLHSLPFPLPNPAIPIDVSLNVELEVETQTVWVDGEEVTEQMFVEVASSTAPPFKGYKDASWVW